MNLVNIKISGVAAKVVSCRPIPRGITGATITLEYTDPLWNGLNKIVTFKGSKQVHVLDAESIVTIPAEAVQTCRVPLRVGVCGVDADQTVVIPTLWTDLGIIQDSAEPAGDPAEDPSLPIWAQLKSWVGDLAQLETTARNDLVAAINELASKSGGTADNETIRRLIEEYLKENPVDIPEPAPAYTLPVATDETLGGVMPVTKTEDMTQPVGVDENGGLFTIPGGGSGSSAEWELIEDIILEEDVDSITITVPKNYKRMMLWVDLYSADTTTTYDLLMTANASYNKFIVFPSGLPKQGIASRVVNMYFEDVDMTNNHRALCVYGDPYNESLNNGGTAKFKTNFAYKNILVSGAKIMLFCNTSGVGILAGGKVKLWGVPA